MYVLKFVYVHRLNSDPSLRLGDVTTLNVTMLGGGVQWNVVPNTMSLGMDLRITVTQDHEVRARYCLKTLYMYIAIVVQ